MLKKSEISKLYTLYKKELIIYIYRMTGSMDIAEDILQDCFVNMISYSQKHDIIETRAFLYKTAHNLSVNYFKKNSRYKTITIENLEIPQTEDTTLKVEFDELNNDIYILLNKLDPIDKSIFIMRKELEMSMKDMAEATGKSERTIRRKLKSITNFLFQNLKKRGYVD